MSSKQLYSKKINEEKILIYTDFLEANGRFSLAGTVHEPNFQYEIYKVEIRPILFRNLNILDDDVIALIVDIDNALMGIDYFQENMYGMQDTTIDIYGKVYRKIHSYVV